VLELLIPALNGDVENSFSLSVFLVSCLNIEPPPLAHFTNPQSFLDKIPFLSLFFLASFSTFHLRELRPAYRPFPYSMRLRALRLSRVRPSCLTMIRGAACSPVSIDRPLDFLCGMQFGGLVPDRATLVTFTLLILVGFFKHFFLFC